MPRKNQKTEQQTSTPEQPAAIPLAIRQEPEAVKPAPVPTPEPEQTQPLTPAQPKLANERAEKLNQLVATVKEKLEAMKARVWDAFAVAHEIGTILRNGKKLIPHGNRERWYVENFGISEKVATNWQRISRRPLDEYRAKGIGTITAALAMQAKHKALPPAQPSATAEATTTTAEQPGTVSGRVSGEQAVETWKHFRQLAKEMAKTPGELFEAIMATPAADEDDADASLREFETLAERIVRGLAAAKATQPQRRNKLDAALAALKSAVEIALAA